VVLNARKGKGILVIRCKPIEAFERSLEEPNFMLYALFMFWIVASISVVVASMVIGGVLCVWCAFIGRRRFRQDVASLLVHRPPSPPAALSR